VDRLGRHRGPAAEGGQPRLACWPAWSRGSISGEGQKSSIAENIAGNKHGAWSG
jgi:hypothetical protein